MTLVVGKIREPQGYIGALREWLNRKLEEEDKHLRQMLELVEENETLFSELSALSARVKELEDENERLKSDLQLVTAPRESVGSVITALRSRIEEVERENTRLSFFIKEEHAEPPLYAGDDLSTELAVKLAETENERDSLRSELSALRRSIERAIAMTQELCSCGGSAPDDPKACDACKIYHALRAAEKGEQG